MLRSKKIPFFFHGQIKISLDEKKMDFFKFKKSTYR